MPTASKRLMPRESTTKDQLFTYFFFLLFRVMSVVLLRFTGVVVAFTLMLPVMIIVFSLDATPVESVVPTLIKIIIWPVSITGRTSYTQDDLDLLVFGWTALAIVIGFIAPKLGLRFRIRFRHKVLGISGVFLTALLILLFNPVQQNKGSVITVFAMLFVACVVATFFAWAIDVGRKSMSKYL